MEETKRARRVISEEELQEAADSVEEEYNNPAPEPFCFKDTDKVISSGSTLLDLAMFGGRIVGGGIPGGIMIEIYSEAGLGKTAIASEICGYAQNDGGDIRFIDPEGRLDREYARIYGVQIPREKYARLHLVSDIIEDFMAWDPPNKKVINVYVCDSLAALTTNLEMNTEDKMGMRRAKELSTLFRKGSIQIAEGHKLMVCTNQLREGDKGTFTPGGKAVGYWASIRIELRRVTQYTKGQINKQSEITEEIKVGAKKRVVESVRGIRSIAKITKNSCDSPYRTAPVALVFGYGIDNIRENLQFVKDMTGANAFECPDGSRFVAINDAISKVESEQLEEELVDSVIEIWEDLEASFKEKSKRIPKRR
jgi:RecA/RadA recombinase